MMLAPSTLTADRLTYAADSQFRARPDRRRLTSGQARRSRKDRAVPALTLVLIRRSVLPLGPAVLGASVLALLMDVTSKRIVGAPRD